MSDQSETSTAKNPVERQLCKMGCGFFGSNATGDCCSKCWGEHQRRQGVSTKKPVAAMESTPLGVASNAASSNSSPEILPSATVQAEAKECKTIVDAAIAKKKKKNTSYKALLAGIKNGSGASEDVDKQREKIRSVTGGGAFVKIDKI